MLKAGNRRARRPVWQRGRWFRLRAALRELRPHLGAKTSTALVIALLLVSYVFVEARRDVLIINPVSVPKSFEENGFAARVIANLILDHLNEIKAATQSRSIIDGIRGLAVNSSSDLEAVPNVEIPGTNLGITTAVEAVRFLLGINPQRVSGEVVSYPIPGEAAAERQLTVTLRVARGNEWSEPIVLVLPNDPELIATRSAEAIAERINPFVIAAYYYRNRCLTETIAEVQRIIHDRARDERLVVAAYNLWGSALVRQRLLDQAVEVFRLAINRKPDYADAYANLGWALQEQGSHREAITMFQKAVLLGDRSAETYTNWGWALENSGRREEGIAKLVEATKRDATFPAAFADLAEIFESQRGYTYAERNYCKAIDLYQRPGGGYLGRFPKSDIDRRLSGVYENFAKMLEKIGQHDRAQELLEKAKALGPPQAGPCKVDRVH